MPVSAAGLAFALAAMAMLLLGPLLGALGQLGLIAMQVGALLAPAWLMAHVSEGSPIDLLGLRRPPPRVIAGSILIGASFWLINAAMIAPVSVELFGDEDIAELSRVFLGVPLPLLLVSQALTPAVCEEVLFRGALARSLEGRLGRVLAILLSAIAFGLIHWPLARVLPATATGLLLAYVALASRSTIAAMVIHFLNNGIALTLAQVGSTKASALTVGAATAAVLTGLAMVRRK